LFGHLLIDLALAAISNLFYYTIFSIKIYSVKKIYVPIIFCLVSLTSMAQSFNHFITTDGTSQFAVLPKGVLDGKTVFTIEFWVKTTENGTNNNYYWQKPTLLGEARANGNDGDFGITTANGAIGMWEGFSSTGSDQVMQTTKLINDNTWHHVAAVNNGTWLYLFVDGVKLDSVSSGNAILTGNSPLTIGASSLNFDFAYSSYGNTAFNSQGSFSEVRVSDNVRYTGNFSPAATYITDAHTVALYDFAGQCGLHVKDLSANHNDITANTGAATCTTLPFGADFTFDGSTQYARLPDGVMNGLSTFTIEGWIKTTDINTSSTFWQRPTIVGVASPGSNSGDFAISTQGGYLYMWTGMNSGENGLQTAAFISDGKWHHIAASANGTAIRLFADGVLQDSLPINRGLSTAGFPISLMAEYAPEVGTANKSTYFFDSGSIEEFRFSDVARYTSSFTPSSTLFTTDASTIALYHLNGCTGAFTPDASGNKDSARLYNFAACALPPQVVQNKILYSHHNQSATASPDSIFTLTNAGNTFVTLGYRPRLSHNGKYLAFSNGPNANSSYGANLYIRNLQTQDEQMIVSNGDYLDYYDFYPSNNKLVYSQGCSIYTVSLDGSNAYTGIGGYPNDCFSDDPTIRVSDSVIAYHNVHYGLYTMGPDGSNPLLVPNTVPGDLDPTWSLDGKWLAYYKPIPGSYNSGAGAYVPTNSVYKIRPDGSDSIKLSFFTLNDTLAEDPIWAKDGKSLYAIGRIHDTMGIYQILTDGSGTYSRVHKFDAAGAVADYWLGLSDSIVTGLLPVHLLNFTGTNLGKAVQLNWQTAQEVNSDYFNIERSTDGRHFNYIGHVKAAGNSSITQDYAFTDYTLPQMLAGNTTYYRLKQLDKDGNYVYSNVVVINLEKITSLAVYPNPGKGVFNLVTGAINKKLDVQVFDAEGRKVYSNTFTNASAALINMPAAKGVYVMKIDDGKTVTTKKLVVE